MPRQPFPREALENPRGFEDRRGALAAALRRSIVKSFGPKRDGWLVLARSQRTAHFGQGRPVRLWLRFERRAGGRWKWAGSGGCDRRTLRDGTTASPWRVDPDRPPGADATEVRALVNELACNPGNDARGRVQAPWVHYGSERITVTYFVTPRTGGGGARATRTPPSRCRWMSPSAIANSATAALCRRPPLNGKIRFARHRGVISR